MGKNDNSFEFHESDLYVACVGDNVRHSIELKSFLKNIYARVCGE